MRIRRALVVALSLIVGASARADALVPWQELTQYSLKSWLEGEGPFPFGVYAMAGNVSEWTSSASPDEPDLRIVAGGSWDSWELADGRTYQRLPKDPNDRSSSLGFRGATAN